MDLVELQQLVAAGESETVEFKKTTADLNGACESLCAFLNGTTPGTVVIGVSNDKLVGQEVSDHTQQEIANALHSIDPRIKIEMKLVPIASNRKAIVLQAHSHLDLRPFTFKGRAFWRTGTTTSLMPREYYHRFVRDDYLKKNPFEKFLARDYSLEKIDFPTIEYVMQKGIQLDRIPKEIRGKPMEMLEKLQLIVDGNPTNAAAILFGTKFFHLNQCCLHMAVFKGTEKGEFLDNRMYTGHAFDLFDKGMSFMRRNIPIWGKIESGNPIRKEDYLIPHDAFREAFVNALCHRDYVENYGRISIAIYDDRLEIENQGSLPENMKVDDLKKTHASQPRNKLIASVFYYYGLIEQWGQGTQKIVNLCTNANLPEPKFSSEKGLFRTTIRATLKAQAPRRISDTKWSLRLRQVYETIAKSQQVSIRDLQSKLPDIPRRTLYRDLSFLKQEKYVSSVGKSQTALWFALNANDS